MSSSEVSICNSALAKIGADRIVSLDEDSRAAMLCKEQYPKVRDEFLRGHPWNFASKRISLAPITPAPAWGYANNFQLPTDCVRVLQIECPEDEWVKEGDKILFNGSTLNILYISNNLTLNLLDACFAEALAAKLAADISYSLVQSVTLKQALMADAKQKTMEARSYDGQEGKTVKVQANLWNGARRSRGGWNG